MLLYVQTAVQLSITGTTNADNLYTYKARFRAKNTERMNI